MKISKPAILVASFAAVIGLAAPPASAARSAFAGRWVSTDVDGSSQQLKVSGGSAPHVKLHDDGATVCSGETVPPDVPATATGRGIVDGDTLLIDAFTLVCETRPPYVWNTVPFSFTDNGDGTLTDSTGVVWTRP